MGLLDLDFHIVRWGFPPAYVRTLRDADGEPVRVLAAGGVYQSATYVGARRMEPVFEYYRAFGRELADAPEDARVLVVGGGGFAVPKLARALRPRAQITVVEIDAQVIDAARRWFYADEARARVVCADGSAFIGLAAARGEKYDFIALDAFAGAEPVASLASPEACARYRRLLAPGGKLAANVVTPGGDASFLRSFQSALESEVGPVRLVPCEDGQWAGEDNYLLVAQG